MTKFRGVTPHKDGVWAASPITKTLRSFEYGRDPLEILIARYGLRTML